MFQWLIKSIDQDTKNKLYAKWRTLEYKALSADALVQERVRQAEAIYQNPGLLKRFRWECEQKEIAKIKRWAMDLRLKAYKAKDNYERNM